jgi:SAM-dependent methyltransferase
MLTTSAEWHARFLIQAQWTARIREYFLTRISIPPQAAILDVGCGTGALFTDLIKYFPHGRLFGLDINPNFLEYAFQNNKSFLPVRGDAYSLPFQSEQFDLIYCHYFFLWIADPFHMIKEIIRVLKTGGVFVAFAEPDYQGRIDYPNKLAGLGKLQNSALVKQGASLDCGRKLPELLNQGGLDHIEVGILGGQWDLAEYSPGRISEWRMLHHDLHDISQEVLSVYQRLDTQAWEQHKRILYIPTFYAFGFKSNSR